MEEQNKYSCKNCGSMYTYVKVDGTRVCRRCGFISVIQQPTQPEPATTTQAVVEQPIIPKKKKRIFKFMPLKCGLDGGLY